MKKIVNFVLCFLFSSTAVFAQTKDNAPLSVQMSETAMKRLWVDSRNEPGIPPRWIYEYGVVLKGIEGVWYATGDPKYFKHIQRGMDYFVKDDGTINTYRPDEYNIDHVLSGRLLLTLYNITGQEKYKKAADLIRGQLKTHPRTNEGGFWHKKIYPYQMWLDGLYMGEPFYTEYSVMFHEDNFNDIANQFVWMEKHSRDDKTGLLYHGWDESKQQRWADKTTGRSPHFWGRAMGWYAMALVDTLDHFPKDHPRRAEIVAILNREAEAIRKVQDAKTGLWWQILDKANEKGNYLEASASCMFVYALAKGVRQGNLPEKYLSVATKGWQGIKERFVKKDAEGYTNLEGTVSVAGLGGNPYRDGSYEYYLSEKVVTNDPKGMGAFIKAANEMEMLETRSAGKGKTVLLDSYFNNEMKKDATGKMVSWHYKWNEMGHPGYSLWGSLFRRYGAKTETLYAAPTAANLKNASIYIIVDPDTDKETEKPNYVSQADIKAIAAWVKAGGVLVLMGNDFGNAEFDNFNNLAKTFGVEFNKDSKNRVQGDNFEQGKITTDANNPIFKTAKTLYLKELSTLKLSAPAKPVLEWNGDKIMAVAKYGKGTVFALGDPWIYNEYVDGRKLPAEYENFKGANDLTRWLLAQSSKK